MRRVLAAVFLATAAAAVALAQETPSLPAPDRILLTDSLGRLVSVPASSLPARLRPPPGMAVERQAPRPGKGAKQPGEVSQRIEAARAGSRGFQLFPAVQAKLMSYLASQDEFGNTAIAPGALVSFFPLEPIVQEGKYRLSEIGLRYTLDQVLTGSGISDPMSGASGFAYYDLKSQSKWTVFDDPAAGTAGWISAQINAKAGLNAAGKTQGAAGNLGTLTDPTGVTSSRNGFRIPELAWQQSLRGGEIVLLGGVVNQSNYLDANTYANTGRGQFLNSALINSMVLPLPSFNFGVNLQWQPSVNWYALLGASAGNASAGQTPWTNFSWEDWSVGTEIGFAPDDVLGLGPGVYRIQPFLARAGGPIQGGLGFNLQQKLGRDSPFAWFGRFGVGGSQVTGASTQVGTGFVMSGPLAHLGLVPRLTNDLVGIGFVWSQPSATTKTVYHRNEYVLETFYTLQFAPTSRLQPDLQVVWNPAFNPDSGPSLVFQFQYILTW
jgi:porin